MSAFADDEIIELGFGPEFGKALNDVQDQAIIPIAKIKDLLMIMNTAEEKNLAVQDLCVLREKALTAETPEQYFNIFVDTWDFMASSKATELPFVLFPRFPNPTTISLRTLTNPIFIMKQYYQKKSTSVIGSGCCRLFTGPKGIGKTTLLTTFYVLVSVLTTHVLSIYWSYDCKVDDPAHWPSVLTLTGPEKKMGKVNESKTILFLGDEVQEVYYKYRSLEPSLHSATTRVALAAERLGSHLKAVIGDLAAVGKSPYNLCFITGSSSNTSDFCLHPEMHGFDFRTLNDSVFTVLCVRPVRQMEEFRYLATVVLSKAHANVDHILTDDMLCWLYNFSGGVGRELEALVSEGLLRDFSLRPLPKLFDSDMALQAIVNEMLFNVFEEAKCQHFNSWLYLHRLQLARVREVLKLYHGVERINEKLSLYQDQSIFYIYDNWVELLYPWHLFHFSNWQIAGVFRNQYERMAFEGTLSGWALNSQRTSASAGHAVEKPLLAQILACEYFQYWSDAGGVYQYNPDHPDIDISGAEMLDLKNISRKLLQGPSNFLGLDGFVFVETQEAVLLYICQIKSGRLNITIDRADLVAWIRKALGGIGKLINLLPQTAQTIVVKEFLLLTTKKVSEENIAWLLEANRMVYDGKPVPITLVSQKSVLNDIEDLAMRDRLQVWAMGNI